MFSDVTALQTRFPDATDLEISQLEVTNEVHQLVSEAFKSLDETFKRQEEAKAKLTQVRAERQTKQRALEQQISREHNEIQALFFQVHQAVQKRLCHKVEHRLHFLLNQTKEKIRIEQQKVWKLQQFIDNHTHMYDPPYGFKNHYVKQVTGKATSDDRLASFYVKTQKSTNFLGPKAEARDYEP